MMNKPHHHPQPAPPNGHWQYDATSTTLIPWDGEAFPTALLWGYSIFTSFRWPLSKAQLALHLNRLQQNQSQWMPEVQTAIPFEPAALHQALTKHLQSVSHSVRITGYPQVHSFQPLIRPLSNRDLPDWEWLISLSTAPPLHPDNTWVKLIPLDRPNASIKHGHYIQEFQALKAFHQENPAPPGTPLDILRVSTDGLLQEASTANVFLLVEGEDGSLMAMTPPLTAEGLESCLPGITRSQVIQWLKDAHIPVSEKPCPMNGFSNCAGVFLTNSVTGIQQVSHIVTTEGEIQALPWPTQTRELLAVIRNRFLPDKF